MENQPQNRQYEKEQLEKELLPLPIVQSPQKEQLGREVLLSSFLPPRRTPGTPSPSRPLPHLPPLAMRFLQVIQQLPEQRRLRERLNSGCMGYEKSKGMTPGGEGGNKKAIRRFRPQFRIASPMEDVLQTKEMISTDTAKEINVDDEQGFPQLTSDTPFLATVDMNTVAVKVIPPPQFSPIAQQENQDEDFGNDEIEEVEICPERTEKDGISLKDAAKDINVVDEDGFPLLNYDTLPSDQASGVNVDTNSVIGKEIPPLQFSLTAKQKNSDEAFTNDEVDEGEFWAKCTEEGMTAEVEFDSKCFVERKRKKKTASGERRNKKTSGKHLKVRQYALKRACQKYGIHRWPPHNEHKTHAVVNEERIPQLTFDTVPFDQALITAVDTNNVALKEIQPQFLLTARLENPDENSCNDEVEANGMGVVGTREGEMKEGELNCRSSDKGERNEKIPRGERASNKTTGVRIEIALEEILKYKNMSRKDAATHLQVSRYALKRACQKYGINRWPPRNEHKTPVVVDEKGILQLTFDNVTFDQALMTSIDTNNVALKDIQPQFLPTTRLENLDENSCNNEVEAVGMGGVGTREGAMKEGELNCGSLDKGERNEKTPRGDRASNKTTGVRIEIALEEILKYKNMSRKDAATHLQVSISTLKRVCREYQIYRWPPRDEHKLIGQSRPNESPAVVDQERNPQMNSTTLLPCNEESTSVDTNSVTVKARYEGNTFKFQLSKNPWGMAELEEQVKKRLQLETQIKYKDEDGDLISIVCDDDLQQCILSSRSQGTTSIVLLLEQKGSR